jgi:hypothetical protein
MIPLLGEFTVQLLKSPKKQLLILCAGPIDAAERSRAARDF